MSCAENGGSIPTINGGAVSRRVRRARTSQQRRAIRAVFRVELGAAGEFTAERAIRVFA